MTDGIPKDANGSMYATDKAKPIGGMIHPLPCAVCGGPVQIGTGYSLFLLRSHPQYRWDRRLPLSTRRAEPRRHDRLNRLILCSLHCAEVAEARNQQGETIGNAAHDNERQEAEREQLAQEATQAETVGRCEHCGEAFTASKRTARFCQPKCRAAWNRAQKKAQAKA